MRYLGHHARSIQYLTLVFLFNYLWYLNYGDWYLQN